ncbi:PREDICTED: uncharacterized protein LOC106815498, partial [Priapulus caudatus]|uniref:Uncharacterized protein LOC106815498 n=1 Tax=Priapulus caudatus TaxID=37621 RepID=A0ABM1ETC6_PRICU
MFLPMPSPKVLGLYKNYLPQTPGFSADMMGWMAKEAERAKLTPVGYTGGLMFDEMSVQEALQLNYRNGQADFVGVVEEGQFGKVHSMLRKGTCDTELATHELQLMFLGTTGFRFPFAHFPTRCSEAATLYTIAWEAVRWLLKSNFKVIYMCFDGAQINRTFVEMHFHTADEAVKARFTMNPVSTEPMVFLMDPSHLIKKLRNNIYGTITGKRCLIVDNKVISWHHIRDAFEWDFAANSKREHHHLTQGHMFLDSASKMRNSLALEVLNEDMLSLLKKYRQVMNLGTTIDGTISFIENTAAIIN